MTSRQSFKSFDGCVLEFEVAGKGKPVLWQHGLGATFSQPAGVFPLDDGLMRITLACRGHENSELGSIEKLSFATFAQDAIALLDHLGIAQCAVGGISLGAGIALRMAAFHPARVTKLILARPAWVDRPSLETQKAYLLVAELIEGLGLTDGLAAMKQHATYQALHRDSPDNAKSILSYFARPRPETTIALLSSISSGYPGISRAQMADIGAPTLVIGNGQDMVHPLLYAKTLSELIPLAQLRVITSKSVNASAYEIEFKRVLAEFLVD